jgi:hypothetical protein
LLLSFRCRLFLDDSGACGASFRFGGCGCCNGREGGGGGFLLELMLGLSIGRGGGGGGFARELLLGGGGGGLLLCPGLLGGACGGFIFSFFEQNTILDVP